MGKIMKRQVLAADGVDYCVTIWVLRVWHQPCVCSRISRIETNAMLDTSPACRGVISYLIKPNLSDPVTLMV